MWTGQRLNGCVSAHIEPWQPVQKYPSRQRVGPAHAESRKSSSVGSATGHRAGRAQRVQRRGRVVAGQPVRTVETQGDRRTEPDRGLAHLLVMTTR